MLSPTSNASFHQPGQLLQDVSDSSILGFGTTSLRAVEYGTSVPPPGIYFSAQKSNTLRCHSPSFSQAGYISGMVSRDQHDRSHSFLQPETHVTKDVSAYHIPWGTENSSYTPNRKGLSYPFLGHPVERTPFEDSASRRDVPGPAMYDADAHHNPLGPKFMRHKKLATFQSQTQRSAVFEDAARSSNSPGPGLYLDVPRPQSPCSAVWTRSHTRRFDNGVFGASQSDPPPPTVSDGHPTVLVDRPRSHYTPKGKLFERPASPVRFFGSEPYKGSDNPRSFLGDLEEQAALPGPGTYELEKPRPRPSTSGSIVTVAGTGTGAGMLKGMGFRTTGVTPVLPSPCFRSKAPNRATYSKQGPGPAYYSPKPTFLQKPTLQNADGKWV